MPKRDSCLDKNVYRKEILQSIVHTFKKLFHSSCRISLLWASNLPEAWKRRLIKYLSGEIILFPSSDIKILGITFTELKLRVSLSQKGIKNVPKLTIGFQRASL